MPKKKQTTKQKRVSTSKAGPHDPMHEVTKADARRASGDLSGEGSASSTDRPQCRANKPNGERCRRPPVRGGETCQMHGGKAGKRTNAAKRDAVRAALDRAEKVTCTAIKRSGDRCSNPPIKGATVCRMHGGGAPQVKAKANQRLIDMVLPAMRELRKIIDSKTASDADKLKAIHMILQRTGFNERHQIDIGLREPNAWDTLGQTAFRIERGEAAVRVPDQRQALPGDGGGDDVDDALDALLDQRERDRARAAETHLNNHGHDVVSGTVEDPDPAAGVFGYPLTHGQQRKRSGYATEHDPDPARRPDGYR